VSALDGQLIGPTAGSCGAAAYSGRRVIVSDIATHPNWTDYRVLALSHGLRACWSSPIFSPEKEVLGTFAMYYRDVRSPSAEELGWVDVATHLASIAILRDRAEQALQRSEARARQLARLHAVASAINEAIVRMREPQSLYDFACRIAVEQELATLAWVGICETRDGPILPVARCGKEAGYVDAIRLDLADDRMNDGPGGRAIRGGRPAVSNDVATDAHFYWKDEAARRGLRSCAVFPLRIRDQTVGVFALYADRVQHFQEEEVDVLTTLATDISFALESTLNQRERRRMEEAVRASETLRALIHDSVADTVFYLAVEGPDRYRFLSVNPAFYAATGLSESGVVGRLVEEVVPEPSRSLVRAKYREAIARSERMSWDEVTPYPSGLKYGEVTVCPILDAEGRCTHLVGTVHDVTMRRRAEEELQGLATALKAANENLERRVADRVRDLDEANRKLTAEMGERQRVEAMLRHAQKLEAIGRLAGGVAHSFNNILTAVLNSLDMVRAPDVDDETAQRMLAVGKHAAERGARVTRQLLTFAGRQRLNPEVIDPSQHLHDFASLLAQSLRGDIAIETSLPDGLWAIEADPSELDLAMLNLGLNARDAMTTGGVVRITASNQRIRHEGLALDGDYVVIAMVDNGSGVAPENLPRVFEPFFTTKDVTVGSGLGLSQVHGFAKQSLGAVEIESALGQGTTVRLYLPATRKPAPRHRAAASPSVERPRAQGTVLVVEDDTELAGVTAALLRQFGFGVKLAYRARAALDTLREEAVDVVFSDILLPDAMSGFELAEAISHRFPQIPVLLATGYAEAAGEAVARGLPIIAKPYDGNELRTRLERLIAGRADTAERSGRPA
jgi:PAS domain S-box-containing protein